MGNHRSIQIGCAIGDFLKAAGLMDADRGTIAMVDMGIELPPGKPALNRLDQFPGIAAVSLIRSRFQSR